MHVHGKPISNAWINFTDENIYCSKGKEYDIKVDYNSLVKMYEIQYIDSRKYTVQANLKEETHEGVDKRDVGILEDHLSKKAPFRHYWQYIAADLNEDKVVDQNDLDLLKVITRNNLKTKWKIIHDHQEKTNENWTNIEEKYTMDAIFVGSYVENFIALKLRDLIGDVFDRKPDVMSIDTEREPE